MRLFALHLLALFMVTSTGAFSADDGIFVSDWRIITGDKSEMTSDCIGKVSSPVCIVDTMMACSLWTPFRSWEWPGKDETWYDGYHPICDVLRKARGKGGTAPRSFELHSNNPNFASATYRIMSFPMIGEALRSYLHYNPNHYKELEVREGDLAVTIQSYYCEPEKKYYLPKEDGKPYMFLKDSPLNDCNEHFGPELERAFILRQVVDGMWTPVNYFRPYRESIWPYLEELYQRRLR